MKKHANAIRILFLVLFAMGLTWVIFYSMKTPGRNTNIKPCMEIFSGAPYSMLRECIDEKDHYTSERNLKRLEQWQQMQKQSNQHSTAMKVQ